MLQVKDSQKAKYWSLLGYSSRTIPFYDSHRSFMPGKSANFREESHGEAREVSQLKSRIFRP